MYNSVIGNEKSDKMLEFQMTALESFFYHWMRSFPMAEKPSDSKIVFHFKDKTGTINFLGDQIVELEIVEKEVLVFSLHFVIDDIKIVSRHFKSFFDFLKEENANSDEEIQIVDTNVKKILFVCSSGVSSSYFASEIEKEFKEIHMDIQVDSTYLDNLKNVIEEYDLVFFAPQVLSHIKEYENYGVKVIGIHSYDFGSWNFHKIINIALCA